MVQNQGKNNSFDDHGRYILRSFDLAPPFSSFLPGVAGLYGIPLWVFYTNRGQAISSFGIESKDRPIMEFQPANKSYQLTATLGFRTFLKGDGWLLEPFSPVVQSNIKRDMYIGMDEVEIREMDFNQALETSVLYFNLINEPTAGLVRKISISNHGDEVKCFEILDGMPAVMPYGVDNNLLKNMGRTIEAWMEVANVETCIPFYRLRATAEDTSDVRQIEAGNFALAASNGKLLPVFVDPAAVFGADTSFHQPHGFSEKGLMGLMGGPQITEGRTPCAFFGETLSLAPGETAGFTSVFGFTKDILSLHKLRDKLLIPDYINAKYAQAQALAVQLTDPIATQSGDARFDAYCRQTFLDNVMRGGWPHVIGDRHIYHIYSRKHGDPERDYNYFFLSAESFSQGNGNFRDVNQNRRSDVFFEPRTADFNIRLFMSLIQIDGYNPLVVEGTRFTLDSAHHEAVLKNVDRPENLGSLLAGAFTPGELLDIALQCGLQTSPQKFIEDALGAAEQHIQARFGEGYWIDHWTYNLDLIEAYLKIYPEKKAVLLLGSDPLPFYDSPAIVNPRAKKYVLDHQQPRQFNAVVEDDKKRKMIDSRHTDKTWVRTRFGQGEVFRLPLLSKLVLLALIKFATRDPFGMGIEMEAGRPGWYDALNGLPGFFGSSMPESIELLRLINFLIDALQVNKKETCIPVEGYALLQEVIRQIDRDQSAFEYWDAVSTAREQYRESTRLGVAGDIQGVPADNMLSALKKMQVRVHVGINDALEIGDGLPPTYFAYQVAEYEITPSVDQQGRTIIKPLGFTFNKLPLFLEGPARLMKVLEEQAEGAALYEKVRTSQLFDSKLGMYKLNASLLEQPHSIGRARAFSRGWLENESIWLHMAYKYLLEMLKSGLYDQFFDDMRKSMPPFMDVHVYGRSPLENSSFLVSSAHPDQDLHGRGFVARLSGATAEFLSMWFTMMTGGKPFSQDEDGKLRLAFSPKLPGWLFPEDGILAFRFLGHTCVRIHNPSRQDTWNLVPQRYTLHTPGGEITVSGRHIAEPHASEVRAGRIKQVDIHLELRRSL